VAALLLSILLHAGLGIVLAGLVWAIGLGWHPASVHAYPLGLLTAVGAAVLVLLTPWLAVVAVPLLLWPLVRSRGRLPGLGRLVWALPGVVGLPVALGLLLHGPTAELDSNAYGDMLFYAAKLVSAEQSIAPFRDLVVEGEPSAYVEAGSTFLGAAVAWLPGFDPILFQTTTLTAFLLTSVPIGLGLLDRGRRGEGDRWLPLVALLGVASIIYPTLLTESPPVALALPLTFSLHGLVRERLALPRFTVVTGALAVAYALTKGFLLVLLAVLALGTFARDHARSLTRHQAIRLAGAAAAVGAAGIVLFASTSSWLLDIFRFEFEPPDALRGLTDQLDRRDTRGAAPGLALLGQLVLLAVLVRIRALAQAAALAVAVLGDAVVGGHGFYILVGSAILLAALHLWQRTDLLAAQWPLVATAAALLGLSTWFRDISSVRAGFVFVALAWLAFLGALGGRRVVLAWAATGAAVLVALTGRSFVAFVLLLVVLAVGLLAPRVRWATAAVALAAALALAAASDLALTTYDPTLTSEHYEVWRRAEQVVPRDGLVFTSLTGEIVSGEQGWNYYPGVIARQVYLAGWSNSILFVDEDERARRLRLNAEVLAGLRPPGEVPLERRYSSFYAVVRAEDAPPPSFERLYANDRFELYRISS
jgi:hypothetical protein